MSTQMPETYERREQREGKVTRMLERESSRIPTDVFLVAAGAAIVGSLILQIRAAARWPRFGTPTRGGQLSLFVGQWAPTFLMLGLYNKMLKLGHEQDRPAH